MVQLMCCTPREVGVEIKTLPGAVIKTQNNTSKKKMEERKDVIAKQRNQRASSVGDTGCFDYKLRCLGYFVLIQLIAYGIDGGY